MGRRVVCSEGKSDSRRSRGLEMVGKDLGWLGASSHAASEREKEAASKKSVLAD